MLGYRFTAISRSTKRSGKAQEQRSCGREGAYVILIRGHRLAPDPEAPDALKLWTLKPRRAWDGGTVRSGLGWGQRGSPDTLWTAAGPEGTGEGLCAFWLQKACSGVSHKLQCATTSALTLAPPLRSRCQARLQRFRALLELAGQKTLGGVGRS
ncbi:unnamed protein product, partial [Symbiodinium necroappetens]